VAVDNNCVLVLAIDLRVRDKPAAEFKGHQLDPDKMAAEFNVHRLGQAKMVAEFSGHQRGRDRTAAEFSVLLAQARMVVGFSDRRARDRTAAGSNGDPATATGPIIAPIGFPTAIDGTTGERITATRFAIIGATIGPITTIGSTTIGGTIITIPISIGTRTSTGGAGRRLER
jgi:hypothetical protein